MEPKFKTIYQGEMIDCEICTSYGVVYRKEGNVFNSIGWYREENKGSGGLPLLPLYQATGFRDKMKQEIFIGHILRSDILQFEGVVKWSSKKARLYIDFRFSELEARSFATFYDKEIKISKSLIIGHVDLVEVKK